MRRTTVQHQLLSAFTGSRARLAELQRRRERGDVPGWVLVTLMTALLVTALLAVARPQLSALLTRALAGFN